MRTVASKSAATRGVCVAADETAGSSHGDAAPDSAARAGLPHHPSRLMVRTTSPSGPWIRASRGIVPGSVCVAQPKHGS